MDTKLKNSKSIAWGISSIFAVAAAEVTYFAFCALMALYELKSNFGYWKGDEENESWVQIRISGLDSHISDLWMIVVGAGFAALMAIIISMVCVGRKNEEGKLEMNWFDKIFTDVQIVALVGLGFLIVLIGVLHIDWIVGSDWYREELLSSVTDKEMKLVLDDGYYWFYDSGFEPRWLELFFAVAGNLVMMSVFLLLTQSIVKKLKARAFWKHTIIGRLVCYLSDAAKESESVFWKLLVVLVGGAILSATWFGLIPVLILIFIFVPKWAKKYMAVKDGLTHIKQGELDYKIPVADHGELDRLAMDINTISESLNTAVQNELKNQRMKTDLISNVSHDLRTPLTSMVSYVDLLKTEGLDSENAPAYLEIIEEKTGRLRKLTEDLFDAAKASSGNIPVSLTKLEMSSIVNQAMGELEEQLSANDLEVIYTNKADMVYVMADGQLLWRVIENLLTNVSKYALPGSRVYLDIAEDGEMIYLDVKNISRDRLNISADELMERFKRGDESRNTEGSGLGLAIAKDLTHLMNGQFEITIDGDLFKAEVALHKAL